MGQTFVASHPASVVETKASTDWLLIVSQTMIFFQSEAPLGQHPRVLPSRTVPCMGGALYCVQRRACLPPLKTIRSPKSCPEMEFCRDFRLVQMWGLPQKDK